MTTPGKLYLIPSPVSENTQNEVIPESVKTELKGIQNFLAEDIRTARRYLSSLKLYESIELLHFEVLNKDTREDELKSLLNPIFEGKSVGVISESGCPGVADPGALAVRFAHANDIEVVPLVGPSSILLALMASGLNGQRFAFQGYLPIDADESQKAIKTFESESRNKNQTQIFIETPYRNNALMANLLNALQPETLLCVAIDVTGSNEFIRTCPVREWRRKGVEWAKQPAVFLFLTP